MRACAKGPVTGFRAPILSLTRETAWKPEMDFERGLKATVDWYRSNPEWIAHVRSGEYQSYHDKNYANRNRELREISTS